MQGFHIPAAPPLYTNTFLLISDAGHAVVIDPAAEVDSYDEILKQHNATLTTILCTHGHYDHVGSAAALKAEWNATLYCEKADLVGDRMYPLSAADCGYTEGEQIAVDCYADARRAGHEDSEIIRAIRSTKMGGRELLALLDNIQAGNVTFLTAVNNASEEAETEEAIEKDA